MDTGVVLSRWHFTADSLSEAREYLRTTSIPFNKEKFRFEWDNWLPNQRKLKKKIKNRLVALSEHGCLRLCLYFQISSTYSWPNTWSYTYIFLNFDTRFCSLRTCASSGTTLLHMVAIFLLIRITLSSSHRTLLISKWLLDHWYDFPAYYYRLTLYQSILIYYTRVLYNIYYIYAVELHLFGPKSITD